MSPSSVRSLILLLYYVIGIDYKISGNYPYCIFLHCPFPLDYKLHDDGGMSALFILILKHPEAWLALDTCSLNTWSMNGWADSVPFRTGHS